MSGLNRTTGIIRSRLEGQPGWAIAAMALLGLALIPILAVLYRVGCESRAQGVCAMIHNNPPWLFITAAAASPSALLTWYWRTSHKMSDIRNAVEDLKLAAEKLKNDKDQQGFERVQIALRHLSSGTPEQLFGVRLLGAAMPALPEDQREAVWHALNGFLRTVAGLSGKGAVVRDALQVLAPHGDDGKANARLDLHGLDLTAADLAGLNLRRADLRAANLDGADMTNACVIDALLVTATCRNAKIAHCDFQGASLEGTDLETAQGIDTAVLTGATYGKNTRFPAGFDPVAAGMSDRPDPGELRH